MSPRSFLMTASGKSDASRSETYPQGDALKRQVAARNRSGALWQVMFQASIIVAIIALAALLYNIINQSFGLVALENKVDPSTLAMDGVPLGQLSQAQLADLIRERISKGVVRRLESEKPLSERSQEELYSLVLDRVVEPKIVESWPLMPSILSRGEIARQVALRYPKASLVFRSWLTPDLIRNPQSSKPELAGVRTALLGSLWTMAITMVSAFPIGVAASIYLEEYAVDNLLNRIIQTNISNLAGVPSIIYGMLGLAIFVRSLERFTSGTVFGLADPTTANGRTIMSASLTLGLLILPVIIINSQEALRAVPLSLRQASLALGATKWQTIWHHVLPNALPGILTGAILAFSRAIGETAPLVVVGAATFITFDPSGPFSKFTTLPIQIYQWTARPQSQFRNIAAAASLVLLVLLLTLNATAILLRNRYSRRG